MKTDKLDRDTRVRAALFVFVLLAMLLFFEKAHPLVILDADDWTYISASRAALPSRRFWNPARILPEILMPYAAGLGVHLFARLGYIPSITVMNGIVLSLFIAWYIVCFYRLLTEKLSLRADAAALLSLLFLLLHFLIFRTDPQNNDYLFRANDVTCVYYYTIPGLLNCGLVMRLLTTRENRGFFSAPPSVRRGVLAAACYLAVFSNLFGSVALSALCGLDLLFGCFERQKIRDFLREQAFNLTVLLLWAVSVYMEGSGERGASGNPMPYLPSALYCMRMFFLRFTGMNRLFLLLAAGAVVGGGAALFVSRKKDGGGSASLFIRLALLVTLCAAFEILLCAKVSIHYILRSDALFVVYASLLCLVTLSLALLLRWKERLLLLLPLLLVLLFSVTDTGLRTFMESNDLYAPAEVCTALDNALIEQITSAERAGEGQVVVHVSDRGSEDNWPQTLYMGPRVAASLFKHGVTVNLMDVQIVRDSAVTSDSTA